jgi:hypothetical protein
MTTIPEAPANARIAYGIEPAPSGPKDHDGITGTHVRGIQDRPSARYNAAAERRNLGKGNLLRNDSELVFVDQRLFRKTTKPETLEQPSAVAAQARGIAWPAQCRLRMLALERTARKASRAPAARLRQ